MHQAVLDWIGQFSTKDDLAVLDIGGRDLNGSPRMFFPNANPYHVLDLYPGPNVDVVADATSQDDRVKLDSNFYDLVICTEVFEHVEKWREVILTARTVLRPGGWLLFTCAGPGRPTHSGITAVWELAPGEYYGNVSPEDVRGELESQGWTDIEARLLGTDTQGCAIKPLPRFKVHEVNLEATLSRTADRAAKL